MGNYRGDFLLTHKEKISGKVVLELAAGAGMVSDNIVDLTPATYFLSDGHRDFFKLNKHKDSEKTVDVLIDILHDLPSFYEQHSNIDTVVCCGFLYHTCHPLWAIEQILLGKPKWFYLESGYSTASYISWGEERLNEFGMQTLYKGALPMFISIPNELVTKAILSLGYTQVDFFGSHNRNLPPPCGDVALDSYASFWVNTMGQWFERND
jgi:hypothetical protein